MSNSLMLKISMVAAAAGAAVMQIPSAEAQTVAVPVTGGGFTVVTNTTEGLTSNYTTLPTFVTPVGTIAVTSAGLPNWQGLTINSTDTAIGVNINDINGNVSLNDGRNAPLANDSAFLQALARVTSFNPSSSGINPETTLSFNPPSTEGFNEQGDYTIVANFQSGSVNVPQSAFSPLPSPPFITITDGTFTLNIPANQAAFPVITTSSLVTPLGTANLTLTFPASVPAEGVFFGSENSADISVVVNGSVVLSDGRIANFKDRLVTFQSSAQVTVPNNGFYSVADVPSGDVTVVGDFSNFKLSILESDIISPAIPSTQSPTFLLTQLIDPSLIPYIVPEIDDSPLSQRRF